LQDANVRGSDEQTALLLAAKHGKADCAAALLEHNAEAGLRDTKGKTALHLAARRGRVDVVEVINLRRLAPCSTACRNFHCNFHIFIALPAVFCICRL